MDRRDFIRATGGLLASAALRSRPAVAAEGSLHDTLHGRSILPMNRNWRYHPAKIDAASAPGFDDSAFTRIVIPHTNVSCPGTTSTTKTTNSSPPIAAASALPQAKGKRVFVDFEGVMTASTVWINGVPLGEYKGGFTPFSFDLTDHLHPDAENVLVRPGRLHRARRHSALRLRDRLHDLRWHLSRSLSAHRLSHLHRQHLRPPQGCAHRQSQRSTWMSFSPASLRSISL